MTLSQILIFVVFALLVALLRRGPGRIQVVQRLKLIRWLLLAGSVLAIYWMQPSMPVRYLDFWLPTATLGLAVLVWAATRSGHERNETREKAEGTRRTRKEGENWWAAAVLAGIVLLVGLMRYLPDPACCLTPTRPPDLWKIIARSRDHRSGSLWPG